MTLKKYITEDKGFGFLKDNYKELLKEFHDKRGTRYSLCCPFDLTLLYDARDTYRSANHSDIIDSSIPMFDFGVLSISITALPKHTDKLIHIDNFNPSKFGRFHLVLDTNDEAQMYISTENTYIPYKWEVGEWFHLEDPTIPHYPENTSDKERIIILMDVALNGLSEEIVNEYYNTVYDMGQGTPIPKEFECV